MPEAERRKLASPTSSRRLRQSAASPFACSQRKRSRGLARCSSNILRKAHCSLQSRRYSPLSEAAEAVRYLIEDRPLWASAYGGPLLGLGSGASIEIVRSRPALKS